MTYIAFLRAINVGGRTVKMEELRRICGELPKLQNVRTYIQSGNIVFESKEAGTKKLSQEIEKLLTKELGYDVPTIVKPLVDIEAMISINPFKKIEENPN